MSIFLPIELTFWGRYLYGKGRSPGVFYAVIRLIRTGIMFSNPVGWLWLGIDLVRRQQFNDPTLAARHCFNSGDAALRGRKPNTDEQAFKLGMIILSIPVLVAILFVLVVVVALVA